jgi:hypothetical protein
MRGGNTSAYGSVLSFIIILPVAVAIIVVWLWKFTKGFFGAAFHHFIGEEGEYVPKD